MLNRVQQQNPMENTLQRTRILRGLASGSAAAATAYRWLVSNATRVPLPSAPPAQAPIPPVQAPAPPVRPPAVQPGLPDGVEQTTVTIPSDVIDGRDRGNEPTVTRDSGDRGDREDEEEDTERKKVAEVTGEDVRDQTGLTLPLRPEFEVGGPELVAESPAQTRRDRQNFSDFNWVPSAGQLGNASTNPLVRMNELEDAIRHMQPLYRNWMPNGTPIPGIARMPPPQITINNYGPQQQKKAWQRIKRQRPDDNVYQPTVKALQNVVQLPYMDNETFTRADYERGNEPVQKRVKSAYEPISNTWEQRLRSLE